MVDVGHPYVPSATLHPSASSPMWMEATTVPTLTVPGWCLQQAQKCSSQLALMPTLTPRMTQAAHMLALQAPTTTSDTAPEEGGPHFDRFKSHHSSFHVMSSWCSLQMHMQV